MVAAAAALSVFSSAPDPAPGRGGRSAWPSLAAAVGLLARPCHAARRILRAGVARRGLLAAPAGAGAGHDRRPGPPRLRPVRTSDGSGGDDGRRRPAALTSGVWSGLSFMREYAVRVRASIWREGGRHLVLAFGSLARPSSSDCLSACCAIACRACAAPACNPQSDPVDSQHGDVRRPDGAPAGSPPIRLSPPGLASRELAWPGPGGAGALCAVARGRKYRCRPGAGAGGASMRREAWVLPTGSSCCA